MNTTLEKLRRPALPVFVATTVMLSFISFWRAAAIVPGFFPDLRKRENRFNLALLVKL